MKKFGKFLAFIGVAGAAVAGFWYFLERSEKGYCSCKCDGGDETGEAKSEEERSYVSLDTTAERIAEAEAAAKRTLKETVKSVAQDMKQKAEDAAKGVGLVKDAETASSFAFESFDKAKETVKEAAEYVKEVVDDAAKKDEQ